jgi:hypothetical protein
MTGLGLPATTIAVADGARDTGVPWMVMAGDPGIRVWPLTANTGTTLKVAGLDPSVIPGLGAIAGVMALGLASFEVAPFTTIAEAEGASEMMILAGFGGFEI